ncbi:hypothetical protein [Pseudomonas sp. BF-R-30]|uniref:hypothetical protein n=1 Tax=Pseudomonas sp. BF-R-30 TaxID=2832384 RepID=UPI001CBF5119|nr:hypothetical protein [Pseudomonas sp. BF-R-30]
MPAKNIGDGLAKIQPSVHFGEPPLEYINMSASDEWTEWHLTPRGWERGSEKEDVAGTKKKDAPTDCVMSVKHRQLIPAAGAPLKETNELLWTSPDEAEVRSLLDQFGPAPKKL